MEKVCTQCGVRSDVPDKVKFCDTCGGPLSVVSMQCTAQDDAAPEREKEGVGIEEERIFASTTSEKPYTYDQRVCLFVNFNRYLYSNRINGVCFKLVNEMPEKLSGIKLKVSSRCCDNSVESQIESLSENECVDTLEHDLYITIAGEPLFEFTVEFDNSQDQKIILVGKKRFFVNTFGSLKQKNFNVNIQNVKGEKVVIDPSSLNDPSYEDVFGDMSMKEADACSSEPKWLSIPLRCQRESMRMPKQESLAVWLKSGDRSKVFYIFTKPRIVIGRNKACDIVARVFDEDQRLDREKSRMISRHPHCTIELSDNTFIIIDHSTGGTFINGDRIEKHTLPADKESIDISLAESFQLTAFIKRAHKAALKDLSALAKDSDIDRISLRRCDGRSETIEYIILNRQVFIGSGAKDAIFIECQGVQEGHARIFWKNGQYYFQVLKEGVPITFNDEQAVCGDRYLISRNHTARIGDVVLDFREIEKGL